MEIGWTLIAYAAAIGLAFRYSGYFKKNNFHNERPATPAVPLVSIILPVRNEANVIGAILNSLIRLDYPAVEIIVVDDSSDDSTREIAGGYGIKIIQAPPKPHRWMGKSWACHIGSQEASGDLFLFTDADTVHATDSLQRAVFFLQQTKSQLISAAAFHKNELWWEKILGPFYCLMHAGVSPHDPVSADNPYALGQYLLFEKKIYERIGGHAAVCSEIADDASLARRVMNSNGKYSIYQGPPLVEVQMYKTFAEFWRGWNRILRLGMQELKGNVVVNTLLPLIALNIPNLLAFTFASSLPVISTMFYFAAVQQKIGRFSLAGILLFPLPILFFVLLSSWAGLCNLFNLPVLWRGRQYYLRGNSVSRAIE